jgi:hypothetical protein
MNTFWDTYGISESQTLPDGTTQNNTTLNIDLNEMLTLSGVSRFSYESPASFMADVKDLLGLLFYLILEHTELPEFVFGNAISSSMASAETQLPVFVKFIEMTQGDVRSWLVDLAEVVLGYLSVTTPGVQVITPTIQFEPLTDSDGNLTLSALTWAYGEGLIDDTTALMLSPLDI